MLQIEHKRKGFTLIEIMVASSIFIIVMFIAVGAILSLVNGNRKAQALSSVVSNLNVSLDSMVREIRTGSNYSFPGNPKSTIQFTNADGNTTRYSLSESSIEKLVTNGSITLETGAITAPDVIITSMIFTAAPTTQPEVLLQINGNVATTTPFTLQTTISQRAFEN